MSYRAFPIAAALLASSCCVVQLILNSLSIGCAGFSALDPYQPLFTTATVILLSSSLIHSRFKLVSDPKFWFTVVTCIVLMASPTLVEMHNKNHLFLIPSISSLKSVSTIPLHSDSDLSLHPGFACLKIHTWKISGLKCQGCAARVKSVLDAIENVERTTVDFENGLVKVAQKVSSIPSTSEYADLQWERNVVHSVAGIDFSYQLEKLQNVEYEGKACENVF
ncbi:hypothetical protein BDR26DRAFT_862354 [Obelidium mucronatum]|nr:hypothetical protein BDR26DRAFT_862354 [Obelidium mucronatum]